LADFVPGYQTDQWWGIGLRKSTPSAITERLNTDMNAILADPQLQARVADLGGTVFRGSTADLAKFVADDTENWAKVVKVAAVKPE
jgi:tripartite-type tricarboxylate transporter receptor subunit TctC